MSKKHLIIDIAKCEDCNNCMIACKDEHLENEWPGYSAPQPRLGQRWMNIMRTERGQYPLIDVAYRPTPCMHCDNAPCLNKGGGAVYKRPDGIVLIDPQKAKGKKEVVGSCPYNAIWWNEELEIAQKCTLCAHLLDQGWKEPRCVQSCPTGALSMVVMEDEPFKLYAQKEELEVLNPEFNTNPGVWYKNMYRFNKSFIAGSVAVDKQGIIDCVQGAAVKVYQGERLVAEELSDEYGDFKVDRLAADSQHYTVVVRVAGFEDKIMEVELKESVNLGEILFV